MNYKEIKHNSNTFEMNFLKNKGVFLLFLKKYSTSLIKIFIFELFIVVNMLILALKLFIYIYSFTTKLLGGNLI